MSKTTNRNQLEILINLMQGNPGIARGFYTGSKDDLNRFWRKAEAELNSAGPPSKNVAEWKKVWADQKKYVRQNAANNNRQRKGTGGGPNIGYKFSATESAIFELIGMKESLIGVAKLFGLDVVETDETEEPLPQREETLSQREETLPQRQETITTRNEAFEEIEEEIEICGIGENEHSSVKFCKPTPVRKEVPKQKGHASGVLAEELNIQREMCNILKNGMIEQERSMKKLYRTLDSLYVVQKQHFKTMEQIKSSELEEIKRHNVTMEKLRLREIEAKLEEKLLLWETEELKVFSVLFSYYAAGGRI
ncbi:PREDICTED: uncharacterized protein LOC108364305 [Rhagoletis zephyria]|uniref:uncharacterized protein LOC108364305 n=1 Tax=Rhagoletis zephyria TaxID=28612 RepID=UPI000811965D|nr:PREDICTED: uncharacterized protein LOC108364305 [Rhagoletis zephyria]